MSTGRKRILLKVVMLGDTCVGKTSILNQYVNHRFDARYKATIGADFLTKELEIDGNLLTLQIWDTAGQERFQSLGSAFYRGADACILVFDLTNPQSFQHIGSWFDEFAIQSGQSNQLILVGNKADLVDKRQVTKRQAMQWCSKSGEDDENPIPYFETSALTNTNLDAAFTVVARNALKKNVEDEVFVSPAIAVAPTTPAQKKKGCC